MAIDTPATIAVIGAGPLGLEAALYARYLGYEARVFERGEVAAEVSRRGDETMLAPFGAAASKLGLAALHAQDHRWRPPSPQATLTGRQWRDFYLLPLARSDLLIDTLREYCEVISVRQTPAGAAWKAQHADEDALPDVEPLEPNFELRLRSSRGDANEVVSTAHVIVDASGRTARRRCARGESPSGTRVEASERTGAVVPLLRTDGELLDDIRRRSIAGTRVTRRAPNYYLLGNAAAQGDEPAVAFVDGLQHIRALFALIGGRESLDLYATMEKLLP